jgi:hypothetical protein
MEAPRKRVLTGTGRVVAALVVTALLDGLRPRTGGRTVKRLVFFCVVACALALPVGASASTITNNPGRQA